MPGIPPVFRVTKRQSRWLSFCAVLLALCCLALSGCAPSAGVFSDGSWQASGLTGIQTLIVRAGTPTTLYASNEQGAVFVSTDSGQHWSAHSSGLPLPNPIYALASSLDGQKLYAATEKGLFVSSSTPEQWNSLPGLPADRYTALDFSVKDAGTLYTGTAQHGVLVSHDTGRSWQVAGQGLPQSEPINDLVVDADAGYAWSILPTGVYRLEMKNTTWQPMHSGLPTDAIPTTILPASVANGNPNLVYLGSNQGFFLSDDAGAHWKRGKDTLSGTRVNQILIDTRNSDAQTLYLATDAGALRSIDGGLQWGLQANGLPAHQPVRALVLGADSYTQLYAAAGAVYQYPGTSGGIAPNKIVPFILFIFFFYLLVRLTRIGRKRSPLPPVSPEQTPEKNSSES